MKITTLWGWGMVVLGLLNLVQGTDAAAPVTRLQAAARDGQVFVTWREGETPEGTTFNVYVADHPIVAVADAKRLAHHVERHSARDWWEDPASFVKHKEPASPVGFLVRSGAERLSPVDGLFVHTPSQASAGRLFFAVTCTDPAGREDSRLVPGENAIREGVTAVAGAIRPIWQRSGTEPEPGIGRGKALWLNLHAKGGVVAGMEYLAFGDATMGWRESLPFKFSVRLEGDEVIVRPTDRVWINRRHTEAKDGGTCAIWTFWYGYNSQIYDRKLMGEGVPTNYTERRNLWILDWVRTHYQPDPNRCYCSGGSMGGCGTISFGLRHPELFVGLHAHVPIVAYTYLGKASATRLEPCCWVGAIPADLATNEGVSLLQRMDGTKFVRECQDDLPPVFLLNGRRDGSIPWENNPPFYRALNDARQAVAVYWDNGEHPTCGKDAPADVKAWSQQFRRFRRDQSYPAFSNTSSNRNPGNGQPDDGDIIGWINRGMDWKDIDDQKDHYAITILADYPGLQYPVRTDLTLRRLQQFQPRPNDRLTASVDGAAALRVQADARGRMTIPSIAIPSSSGVRIVIQREPGTQ